MMTILSEQYCADLVQTNEELSALLEKGNRFTQPELFKRNDEELALYL